MELRNLRLVRERAVVERELSSLQEQGVASDDKRINELGKRQLELTRTKAGPWKQEPGR
jgi:hypothetical protein